MNQQKSLMEYKDYEQSGFNDFKDILNTYIKENIYL